MGTDIVERLVSQVFAETGLPHEVPVPVEELATALGVQAIRPVEMVEDGRLELRDGQPTIFVRANVNPARQRFTIAHELGHLVLADRRKDLVAKRTADDDRLEERLCDAIAAAVLLPRHWMRSFSAEPERLYVLRDVAERSGASLSASIVRLQEVANWRRAFLHWKRHRGKWRLRSAAGLPWELHNRLTSVPNTRRILESLRGSGTDLNGAMPLAIEGAVWDVPVEISVRANAAVALAALDRTG